MTSLLANPLLHRAVRSKFLPWPQTHWRRWQAYLFLALVAGGGTLVLYGRMAKDSPDYTSLGSIGWLSATLLGFGLPWFVPAITAPIIARERAAGSLDLLRVTTLGEGRIVLGKALECLVRLWPAVLVLAVLTPLQTGWDIWSQAATGVRVDSFWDIGSGGRLVWVVGGALLPWSHLAFNGAVGLFASTWSRFPGVAVAASYGFLVVVRVCVRVLVFFASFASISIAMGSGGWEFDQGWALPLVEAAFEAAAAVLLVWGTAWRLRRE